MNRTILFSETLLRWVGITERLVAGLILCGVVITIIIQVCLNAGLGNPIPWEQEGGAYALVWMTFLGASIGLKQMRHVTIVSVVTAAPEKIQAIFRCLCWLLVIWLLATIMHELLGIMPIEGRATTVALPIDLPRSYFFSVPLFISSGLMIWTSLHYLVLNAMRLVGTRQGDPKPILVEKTEQVDLI